MLTNWLQAIFHMYKAFVIMIALLPVFFPIDYVIFLASAWCHIFFDPEIPGWNHILTSKSFFGGCICVCDTFLVKPYSGDMRLGSGPDCQAAARLQEAWFDKGFRIWKARGSS